MTRARRECPTPFKLRFSSRREARVALMAIARRTAAQRGSKRVARLRGCVYECGCGGYHLTRRRNGEVRPVAVWEVG